MQFKIFRFSIVAVFFVLTTSIGVVFALNDSDQVNYKLGGYGFWQFGEVMQGSDEGTMMDHQWTTAALLGVKVSAKPSERLQILLNPEFKLYFPYPLLHNAFNTKRANAVAYINNMNGIYSFGDVENPFASLSLGMFTYKYNPDVKDLGEYMFRTGTYPQFIITDFDFAKARLCGLRGSVNPIPDLNFDVLFTTELQYYPLYDFSLSFFGKYKFLKSFEVGAGTVLARLIPVDNSKTKPNPNITGFLNPTKYEYIKDNGDTGYYSFQSPKFMARATIDPKGFFSDLELFGKEDLKLYGELGILALPYKTRPDETHPAYYKDLSQFMPIMLGFNLPCFKLLDVVSAEVEYFPSRLPNSYYRVLKESYPMPYLVGAGASYDPDNYKGRDLGWAFYAKKELVKGFSLTGQISYDHSRNTYTDGSPSMGERLTKQGDWDWNMQAGYSF